MTDRPKMGIQKARDTFRTVVDNALVHGTKTVIERHGQPVAAVVPYEWLTRAEAALGEGPHDDSTSSR